MKTYVINLDKNTDRLLSMDSQLKKLGIVYERIPAIYGANLSKEELKHDFCRVRSYLASGQRLRDGEIGCALSHCMIYKKMIYGKINAAMVLEDDIVINEAIIKVLAQIEEFMDFTKPQVFLLSALDVSESKHAGIERIAGGLCTDGYVLTLPAANCIYRANYPVVTVADKWIRWEKRFGVEMYRAWPTVVGQDNDRFGTDISINKFPTLKGWRKLLHKSCRVFELFLDWMWYKISGR